MDKNKILELIADLFEYADDYIKAKNVVERIYDDFESRVCKNCKYRTVTPNGKLICLNKNEITKKIVLEIYDDFGCNNFERR